MDINFLDAMQHGIYGRSYLPPFRRIIHPDLVEQNSIHVLKVGRDQKYEIIPKSPIDKDKR